MDGTTPSPSTPQVTTSTARQLPAGVRSVCRYVFVGPNAAVPEMVRDHGCRGIVSLLEEPSVEDQQAQQQQRVRLLHVPLEDDPSQRLHNLHTVVDFIGGLTEEFNNAAAESDDDHDEGGDATTAGDDGPAEPAAATTTSAPAAGDGDPSDKLPALEPPAAQKKPQPSDVDPCVFIHCHAGQSRAIAIALAFLMLGRDRSLREAVEALVGAGNHVQINPGFMVQLYDLDCRLRHGASDFDMQSYFVQNLLKLFPRASEADVKDALEASGNNVLQARNALMRKFAAGFVDRDRIMVDCLVDAVKEQAIPRSIVERIYNEEGKQRDRALARLLNLSPEELIDLVTDEHNYS